MKRMLKTLKVVINFIVEGPELNPNKSYVVLKSNV